MVSLIYSSNLLQSSFWIFRYFSTYYTISFILILTSEITLARISIFIASNLLFKTSARNLSLYTNSIDWTGFIIPLKLTHISNTINICNIPLLICAGPSLLFFLYWNPSVIYPQFLTMGTWMIGDSITDDLLSMMVVSKSAGFPN